MINDFLNVNTILFTTMLNKSTNMVSPNLCLHSSPSSHVLSHTLNLSLSTILAITTYT